MAEQRHKLFVGNLPPDLTQEEIKMVFNTYGNCVDAHIMHGKSRSGQSCAFVSYDTAQAAESAIQALNNVYSFRQGGENVTVAWAKPAGGAPSHSGAPPVIGGTPVTVPPPGGYGSVIGAPAAQPQYGAPAQYGAPPVIGGAPMQYGAPPVIGGAPPMQYGSAGGYGATQPQLTAPMSGLGAPGYGGGMPAAGGGGRAPGAAKLFVGNLPADIQQEAVRMVFGHYGQVTNVHIMAGKSKSGQSCAFVEYATTLEAETAILTLNDKYEIRPGEGCIMVKHSSSPSRAGPY